MWWNHVVGVGLPLLLIPTAALFVTARWGSPRSPGTFRTTCRRCCPSSPRRAPTRDRPLDDLPGHAARIRVRHDLTWIDGVRAEGFLQAYGMAFATFLAFCLIDLFIVDWLVICWWRPSWIVIRGTEQAEGWGTTCSTSVSS